VPPEAAPPQHFWHRPASAGLDSLNEIVVRDDSQIVEITARKRFSIAPKLAMTVFPLDAGCSNRGAK
jgi:hypothetical protein